MADHTHIAWADSTWNPITGCSPASAGCLNCFAARDAHRMAGNPNEKIRAKYEGLTKLVDGRAVFNGQVRLTERVLLDPCNWRKGRRIFVCSMSDLFHPAVTDHWIDLVFATMAICPQHTFLVLTKRPERMAEYLAGLDTAEGHQRAVSGPLGTNHAFHGAVMRFRNGQPFPNIHLGTSIETQRDAERRLPHLLRCPAAVRFLSVEPLLEPISLFAAGMSYDAAPDQVIIGGESGANARPCDLNWIRHLRDQCRTAGASVFVKQLGAHAVQGARHEGDTGYRLKLNHKSGADLSEVPVDLRFREYPTTEQGELL